MTFAQIQEVNTAKGKYNNAKKYYFYLLNKYNQAPKSLTNNGTMTIQNNVAGTTQDYSDVNNTSGGNLTIKSGKGNAVIGNVVNTGTMTLGQLIML